LITTFKETHTSSLIKAGAYFGGGAVAGAITPLLIKKSLPTRIQDNLLRTGIATSLSWAIAEGVPWALRNDLITSNIIPRNLKRIKFMEGFPHVVDGFYLGFMVSTTILSIKSISNFII